MIRKISAEETYKLRQLVLRPGRPVQECFFEGDLEPETLHLGYFVEESLAGIATWVARSNSHFENQNQFQLRGMAVLPEYRGKQIGENLLLKGEQLLKKKEMDIILWCNARETAVAFYEKFGYRTIGAPFMIPNVCMHLVMYKKPTEL